MTTLVKQPYDPKRNAKLRAQFQKILDIPNETEMATKNDAIRLGALETFLLDLENENTYDLHVITMALTDIIWKSAKFRDVPELHGDDIKKLTAMLGSQSARIGLLRNGFFAHKSKSGEWIWTNAPREVVSYRAHRVIVDGLHFDGEAFVRSK